MKRKFFNINFHSFLRVGYRLRSNMLGIHSVEDCTQIIFRNIRGAVADKELLNEAKYGAKSDKRLALKYEYVIASRMRKIKDNLIKLGANKKCINETLGLIENNDIDGACCNVLKLLAQRNPNEYKRRLAVYRRHMEQKQRG